MVVANIAMERHDTCRHISRKGYANACGNIKGPRTPMQIGKKTYNIPNSLVYSFAHSAKLLLLLLLLLLLILLLLLLL